VCTAERDYEHVQSVCHRLNIPCSRVSFVQEYWNEVFRYEIISTVCSSLGVNGVSRVTLFPSPFPPLSPRRPLDTKICTSPCWHPRPFSCLHLRRGFWCRSTLVEAYSFGATPNPDILCNHRVKFDVFLQHAHSLGADYLATGHYARTEYDPLTGRSCLLKAIDPAKDQTFFLGGLSGDKLNDVLFPLGDATKGQVRAEAIAAGLGDVAQRQESMGVSMVWQLAAGDKATRHLIGRHPINTLACGCGLAFLLQRAAAAEPRLSSAAHRIQTPICYQILCLTSPSLPPHTCNIHIFSCASLGRGVLRTLSDPILRRALVKLWMYALDGCWGNTWVCFATRLGSVRKLAHCLSGFLSSASTAPPISWSLDQSLTPL